MATPHEYLALTIDLEFAAARMPPDQWRILRLLAEGYTAKEIATEAGLPSAYAARKAILAIRRRLTEMGVCEYLKSEVKK